MSVAWSDFFRMSDYMGEFLLLKISRTTILSALFLIFILLIRKCVDLCSRRMNQFASLYLKAYLWLLMLPVPFLGGLKLSYEHFYVRNYIYVVLYQVLIGNAFVARLYFLAMAVIFSGMVIRKQRLRMWVRRLPICDDPFVQQFQKNQRTKVCVRMTPLRVTPFTTGIIRHTIILPEYILRDFEEDEMDKILQHEYCHICRGHLIIYQILDLLRILWFLNPLVHYCAKLVKDDLEMICDNSAIRMNTYNPESYGMTLLKSVMLLKEDKKCRASRKGVPAFSRGDSFSVMKKRMQSVAGYQEYSGRYLRRLYGFFAVLAVVLFITGKCFSYPAYTPFEGYTLYSYDGKRALIQENAQFDAAIEWQDSGLLVDNSKVNKVLQDAEITGEGDYWIYYGGYMKFPGIGGGGDILSYSPAPDGKVLIPFNKRNGVMEAVDWMLKHI